MNILQTISSKIRSSWQFFRICMISKDKELYRSELESELNSRWPGHAIRLKELVYERFETDKTTNKPKFHDEDFVVFIDINNDIDWIHRSDPPKETTKYISKAEAVGAKRAKHLPMEQRLELKRLVGQAIVSAIFGESETSVELINSAESFHTKRTIEVSKIWKLEFAFIFLLLFTSLFFVSQYFDCFNNVTIHAIAMYAGALGSFCSISMKRHNSKWDAESGKHAHALEVFFRMLLGGIFGFLFSIASRTSIIPPIFEHDASDHFSLFIFCFASGYSERLVLNIISSYIQSPNEKE